MVAITSVHLELAALAALFSSATAAPSPTITQVNELVRRHGITSLFAKRAASCTFPKPPSTSSLSAPITVTDTFDGGNVRFDRGSGACTSQSADPKSGAVFLVKPGGTVQNVVIAANQAEGIYCLGPCNLYNVWFEDVCETAITIEQTAGQSNIIGGGAISTNDTVVQHNGAGTVVIDSYCVQSFGKLYNSCSDCLIQHQRTVVMSQIIATKGTCLASINSSYGDTAKIDTASLELSSVGSIICGRIITIDVPVPTIV